jgi:hypothetical protein
MLSGSMPEGGIGITASPSQNGCAINDEVTGSNESPSHGMHDREYEERLMHRSPCGTTTFALL